MCRHRSKGFVVTSHSVSPWVSEPHQCSEDAQVLTLSLFRAGTDPSWASSCFQGGVCPARSPGKVTWFLAHVCDQDWGFLPRVSTLALPFPLTLSSPTGEPYAVHPAQARGRRDAEGHEEG